MDFVLHATWSNLHRFRSGKKETHTINDVVFDSSLTFPAKTHVDWEIITIVTEAIPAGLRACKGHAPREVDHGATTKDGPMHPTDAWLDSA